MNSPDDLEERMRQLEKEMNFNQAEPPIKRAEPERTSESLPHSTLDPAKLGLSGLVSWVNSLTGVTKVVAIVGLGIVAFSILKFVFNLFAAVVSLGLMALVAYVLYKLFFETQPPASKL